MADRFLYRRPGLRVGALRRRPDQLVQGVEIGLGRGDDDVRVRPVAVDDAPALLQAHGDLALRVRAGGDVADGIEQQLAVGADDAVNRLEGRIHRPAALYT